MPEVKKKRKSKWKTAPSWTGAKMGKKWPKNGKIMENSLKNPFLGRFLPFLPLSSLGPFSVSISFFFFFVHFRLLAVFLAIPARQDAKTGAAISEHFAMHSGGPQWEHGGSVGIGSSDRSRGLCRDWLSSYCASAVHEGACRTTTT